jgi:hypothetical protein
MHGTIYSIHNRRGNHEWTIQRPWQHWGQDTNQRQTKQLNTTQKIKTINNMDTTTKQDLGGLMPLGGTEESSE